MQAAARFIRDVVGLFVGFFPSYLDTYHYILEVTRASLARLQYAPLAIIIPPASHTRLYIA